MKEKGLRRYQRLLKVAHLRGFAEDLFGIFYPPSCAFCGRRLLPDFAVLCPECLSELPLCGFSGREGNRLEQLFHGRVRLQAATSYLYFRKLGMVQRLIHSLKYKGHEHIGKWLGCVLGHEMILSGRFSNIEVVIPVPIHARKKLKRGYNQASGFGCALAESLDVPFEESALKRIDGRRSQTTLTRMQRNERLQELFTLEKPELLIGRHVLIVDDIITTGATLEACSRYVLELPGTQVSLASMAFTL